MKKKIYPKDVTCPACGAKPGVPCGGKYGMCLQKAHPERIAAWKEENRKRREEDGKDTD